jgi:hypothetical protein
LCGIEQLELARHAAKAATMAVIPKTSEHTIMAVNTGFRRHIYQDARKTLLVLIIIASFPFA